MKTHALKNMHCWSIHLVIYMFFVLAGCHVFFRPKKAAQTEKKGPFQGSHFSNWAPQIAEGPLRSKKWVQRGSSRVWKGTHGLTTTRELAKLAKKIWVKKDLLFLSEVTSESMETVVGWVCDERPNAVMEKHEMVAIHASIWNEKRPVQPHKVETQTGLAQSRVCLGQVGY